MGDQYHIIGTDPNRPFTGVFDGVHRVISNFRYVSKRFPADEVGLFGVVAELWAVVLPRV